jgi:hypothetical protein
MPLHFTSVAGPRPSRTAESTTPSIALGALVAFLLLTTLLTACSHERHTYDPRLSQIDDLLSKQLPAGSTRGRVDNFLRSRGYRLENIPDKTVIRVLVHHVDPDTLKPSAAHATFHFDSNDKLTTFQLEPAPEAP